MCYLYFFINAIDNNVIFLYDDDNIQKTVKRYFFESPDNNENPLIKFVQQKIQFNFQDNAQLNTASQIYYIKTDNFFNLLFRNQFVDNKKFIIKTVIMDEIDSMTVQKLFVYQMLNKNITNLISTSATITHDWATKFLQE